MATVGKRPYVAKFDAQETDSSDRSFIDFDEFFDDMIASCETSVESFFSSCTPFLFFGIWSGISVLDLFTTTPIRTDWFAFGLSSIRILHRPVRMSFVMILLLLLFFTVVNTTVMALFNLPYGSIVMPGLTNAAMYAHVAFCMGPRKSTPWAMALILTVADALIKPAPKSDKAFLTGAHCISYAIYSVLSKSMELFGDRYKEFLGPSVQLKGRRQPIKNCASYKKSTSRVPSDWNCLIFRGIPPSTAILAVAASDIVIKVNGALHPKSDFFVNFKKRMVFVKLTANEEVDVSIVVAGLESEPLRLLTPNRSAVEKPRKYAYSRQPPSRSIGVMVTESHLQSDGTTPSETISSDPAFEESTTHLSANTIVLLELRKELEAIQSDYKSGQCDLRRLRREYTRADCNIKSEIELWESSIAKGVVMDHKIKQKFQTIQESIGATEMRVRISLDEVKSITDLQNSMKNGELKTYQLELGSLKEALKTAEKAYSKATSLVTKTTTVTLAEMSALQKILEDGQKELKAADLEILSLRSGELTRIDSQVDCAWSKQAELKEASEHKYRLLEAEIDERKADLDTVRQLCEEIHSKNTGLEKSIADKRARNDQICEELMRQEDSLSKPAGRRLLEDDYKSFADEIHSMSFD
ncbi:hypothetical protein HDU98_007481 [Podochytrium sp. JEL0797]|nr:hypothetical protein HDU98_007481 [Podochytrium sp. JEL0797]